MFVCVEWSAAGKRQNTDETECLCEAALADDFTIKGLSWIQPSSAKAVRAVSPPQRALPSASSRPSSLWTNVSPLHPSEPGGIGSACRLLLLVNASSLCHDVQPCFNPTGKQLLRPSCVSLCCSLLLSSTDELWRKAGWQEHASIECILNVWLDVECSRESNWDRDQEKKTTAFLTALWSCTHANVIMLTCLQWQCLYLAGIMSLCSLSWLAKLTALWY